MNGHKCLFVPLFDIVCQDVLKFSKIIKDSLIDAMMNQIYKETASLSDAASNNLKEKPYI